MRPSSKWFWIFIGFFLIDLVMIGVPIGALIVLIGAFYPPLLRWVAHVFLEYAGEPVAQKRAPVGPSS